MGVRKLKKSLKGPHLSPFWVKGNDPWRKIISDRCQLPVIQTSVICWEIFLLLCAHKWWQRSCGRSLSRWLTYYCTSLRHQRRQGAIKSNYLLCHGQTTIINQAVLNHSLHWHIWGTRAQLCCGHVCSWQIVMHLWFIFWVAHNSVSLVFQHCHVFSL